MSEEATATAPPQRDEPPAQEPSAILPQKDEPNCPEPSAMSHQLSTTKMVNTTESAAPSIPAQCQPHTIAVTLMKPGLSKATIQGLPVLYTEEALRNSLPLWNGITCFCDHFNKSVRNIIGVFFDPYYEDGVKAKLRLTDAPMFTFVNQVITDSAKGLPVPNIGLSADLDAVWQQPADDHVEVTKIVNVFSTDLVFAPAAGGSFDRVLNSLGDLIPPPADPTPQVKDDKRVRDLQSACDKLRTQLQNQTGLTQEAMVANRAALAALNPDVPPEMLTGETVAELNASLKNAQNLVEQVRQNLARKTPAEIPAGAPGRVPVDYSKLTPDQKIKRGLELRL